MEAAEIEAVGTGAKRGRGGRPAAGREHEVTARLLAAATRLFLKNGYDGTTCDQVAIDAKAGKASIYTRYANKEALFVAVIDNVLAAPAVADAPIDIPASAPQRMAAAGRRVLADALAPDAVALLRLLLAEQARFAGAGMDHMFWKAGVRRVAAAIDGAGDNGERAIALAERFVELSVAPLLLRALMGEAGQTLLALGPARIDDALAVLAADGAFEGLEKAST